MNNITLKEPKTKDFFAFLTAQKAKNKPLVVIEKQDPVLLRAARNISGLTLKVYDKINAYDVLKHKKIIFSKAALENLMKLRKKQ